MNLYVETTLEQRIQEVLNDYRPNLYMDGGDVEVLEVDAKGVAHLKMLGACIDCPISLLTMKLGIQRLLKERPKALGLAVPSMPLGSPGMDGPAYEGRRHPYQVLLVQKDGSAQVFNSYS